MGPHHISRNRNECAIARSFSPSLYSSVCVYACLLQFRCLHLNSLMITNQLEPKHAVITIELPEYVNV